LDYQEIIVQLPAGVRDLPLLQNAHSISVTHPAAYSVAAGGCFAQIKRE